MGDGKLDWFVCAYNDLVIGLGFVNVCLMYF